VKTLALAAMVAVMLVPALTRADQSQKADQPATKVCTLKVSGMTCAGCEAAVRMAARSTQSACAWNATI